MALPTNYIKKRDLLHSQSSSPGVLSRTGKDFLAQERYSDALDFFEKANDNDGIAEIKKIALASGDTFLLARLDRFNAKWVTLDDWQAAASKAESSGRSSMARFVARKFAPPAGTAAAAKPAELPGSAPLAEV